VQGSSGPVHRSERSQPVDVPGPGEADVSVNLIVVYSHGHDHSRSRSFACILWCVSCLRLAVIHYNKLFV